MLRLYSTPTGRQSGDRRDGPEHILIPTHDPAGTRDWWCQTLGLREGDHPDFGFPVH
jgi:hypothetical protein